jgi:hypothetical protein
VRKLQRVKVLFEDDLRAAVASFDTAFGEVEQRVLQVVHNFLANKQKPDSVVSKALQRHRGSHRRSTDSSTGSVSDADSEPSTSEAVGESSNAESEGEQSGEQALSRISETAAEAECELSGEGEPVQARAHITEE